MATRLDDKDDDEKRMVGAKRRKVATTIWTAFHGLSDPARRKLRPNSRLLGEIDRLLHAEPEWVLQARALAYCQQPRPEALAWLKQVASHLPSDVVFDMLATAIQELSTDIAFDLFRHLGFLCGLKPKPNVESDPSTAAKINPELAETTLFRLFWRSPKGAPLQLANGGNILLSHPKWDAWVLRVAESQETREKMGADHVLFRLCASSAHSQMLYGTSVALDFTDHFPWFRNTRLLFPLLRQHESLRVKRVSAFTATAAENVQDLVRKGWSPRLGHVLESASLPYEDTPSVGTAVLQAVASVVTQQSLLRTLPFTCDSPYRPIGGYGEVTTRARDSESIKTMQRKREVQEKRRAQLAAAHPSLFRPRDAESRAEIGTEALWRQITLDSEDIDPFWQAYWADALRAASDLWCWQVPDLTLAQHNAELGSRLISSPEELVVVLGLIHKSPPIIRWVWAVNALTWSGYVDLFSESSWHAMLQILLQPPFEVVPCKCVLDRLEQYATGRRPLRVGRWRNIGPKHMCESERPSVLVNTMHRLCMPWLRSVHCDLDHGNAPKYHLNTRIAAPFGLNYIGRAVAITHFLIFLFWRGMTATDAQIIGDVVARWTRQPTVKEIRTIFSFAHHLPPPKTTTDKIGIGNHLRDLHMELQGSVRMSSFSSFYGEKVKQPSLQILDELYRLVDLVTCTPQT